jgi:hypothetical protein
MGWKQLLALGSLVASIVACGGGTAAGPPEPIQKFAASDVPITASGVSADEGGWRVERSDAGSVPLFEVPAQRLESAILTYRAHMKASDVAGKAYLEMWVRVPGRGEFFSRGLAQPLNGTSGWASYEIPFFLNEKGVTVDLVKLNVAFEGGGGTVWIKDVELLKAPLAG